jgi:hypothetical protein
VRLFLLILFAVGVGAALGHFGPVLLRGSDQTETELEFPAPDPDPKYVKAPQPRRALLFESAMRENGSCS